VSNPPFQQNKEHGELYPMLFLQKIVEIFGKTKPVVLITGHWMLSNSSERIKQLREDFNITKKVTLHKNIFNTTDNNSISVESNILFFNLKTKKPIDFLDYKEDKKAQPRKMKALVFNKAQAEYIEKLKIKNFNDYVKSLFRKEFSDFPD
jgi:hypothetical protein